MDKRYGEDYKVTLSDGTLLDGLGLNGTTLVSYTEVTEATFKDKLSKVVIEGPEESPIPLGEHGPMELAYLGKQPDGWYFVIQELPQEEQKALKDEILNLQLAIAGLYEASLK